MQDRLTMPRRPRHPAFTLLEMVVAVAVLSILSAGIGSVFVLASRALPSSRGASETTITAAAALDQLVADLRIATRITAAAPTSITFTVPDRSGDGIDETIAYSWAGAGSPVLRTYNDGAASTLLASAASFALAYTRRVETTTQSTITTQDSGEVLLSSFAGWTGVTPTTATMGLSTTSWTSEAFTVDKVTIPSDVIRWYISKVSLRLGKSLLTSPSITVSVCLPASSGSPVAGTAVGSSATITPGLLALTPGWLDATFSDVSFTDPAIKNLVIRCKATTSGGLIEYLNSSSAPVDAYTFLYTSDSGGTWNPSSNRNRNDARFFVYGGYVRTVQTQVQASAYFLGSANIVLQPTSESATRLDTGFALLNQPEIPAP
jgi:prepilin-type N-terminal cleavage/methylation domain-containing protein